MPDTLAETSGIDSSHRGCSASAGQYLFSVTRLLHCIVTCTCAPFLLFNFWRSEWWACFVARRKQWRKVSTNITSRKEDWRASAIAKAPVVTSGAPRHICGLLAGRRSRATSEERERLWRTGPIHYSLPYGCTVHTKQWWFRSRNAS